MAPDWFVFDQVRKLKGGLIGGCAANLDPCKPQPFSERRVVYDVAGIISACEVALLVGALGVVAGATGRGEVRALIRTCQRQRDDVIEHGCGDDPPVPVQAVSAKRLCGEYTLPLTLVCGRSVAKCHRAALALCRLPTAKYGGRVWHRVFRFGGALDTSCCFSNQYRRFV